MKRTCKQCGKEFELSNSEIGFYKKRNLSLPRRCKECRQANRSEKKQGSASGQGQSHAAMQNPVAVQEEAVVQKPVKEYEQSANTADKKPKGNPLLKVLIAAVVLLAVAFGLFPKLTDTQGEAQPAQENTASEAASSGNTEEEAQPELRFRNKSALDEHYEKHGIEMNFASAEAYEKAAAAVVSNPAVLHKTEKEDGDDVYYLEESNEFVIVSQDGFLRTYFNPDDGKAYFDRQ